MNHTANIRRISLNDPIFMWVMIIINVVRFIQTCMYFKFKLNEQTRKL